MSLSISQFIIHEVLPFLGDADSVVHREGAIEALACIFKLKIICTIAVATSLAGRSLFPR